MFVQLLQHWNRTSPQSDTVIEGGEGEQVTIASLALSAGVSSRCEVGCGTALQHVVGGRAGVASKQGKQQRKETVL